MSDECERSRTLKPEPENESIKFQMWKRLIAIKLFNSSQWKERQCRCRCCCWCMLMYQLQFKRKHHWERERFRGAPPATCLSMFFSFIYSKAWQCEFSFEIIIEIVTTTHKLRQHPQSINCSASLSLSLALSRKRDAKHLIEYWAVIAALVKSNKTITNKCNKKMYKMCHKHA